jgi:hypothetical protein
LRKQRHDTRAKQPLTARYQNYHLGRFRMFHTTCRCENQPCKGA